MTKLVYFKSNFLPLGSTSISLTWLEEKNKTGAPWSVLSIKDHGSKTLEAVVLRQQGGVDIYRLSISIDEGRYGFDLGDGNSVPIEKILLNNRYLVTIEGGLINLSGMGFREFYSRYGSSTNYFVTIKFNGHTNIDLAKKIVASVEDGDLQNFGSHARYTDSIIIWTRSREQCYLVTFNPDLAMKEIHKSLNSINCEAVELDF